MNLSFNPADRAMLRRVCAKYRCQQMQALRLGLLLLDEHPALQVELPPPQKRGPKPKAPATPPPAPAPKGRHAPQK